MQDVLKLWREASSGILSTTSVVVEGYPFGSVVPYVTLDSGAPVIYISTISQHYKNLSADARTCLTVVEAVADDPQAGARISLLADAAPVSAEAVDAVGEAYFELFPASRQFAGTHGFQFWVLQPKRIRFIGGFGKIYWIEAEDWAAAAK
ncbi:MAG: putative heme iron utilization protein [Planctomycetota bacterium]|jgi:putative heme iron utilization protein